LEPDLALADNHHPVHDGPSAENAPEDSQPTSHRSSFSYARIQKPLPHGPGKRKRKALS
jgi:hypothetical protein